MTNYPELTPPQGLDKKDTAMARGLLDGLKEGIGPSVKEGLGKLRDFVGNIPEYVKSLMTWAGDVTSEKIAQARGQGLKKTLMPLLAFMFLPHKIEEDKKQGKQTKLPTSMEEIQDYVPPVLKEAPTTKEGQDKFTDAFIEVTGQRESGNKETVINTHAMIISQEKTNALGKNLIEKIGEARARALNLTAIKSKWYELFVTKPLPATYEEFEKSVKQANIPLEVLANSAVGKYQIIPVYHYEKIGLNPYDLRAHYEFLKNPEKQREAVTKIVQKLGERYNWNYMYMAAAYYGGTKAGDALRDNPDANWLARGQGKYSSIATYAQKTSDMVEAKVGKRPSSGSPTTSSPA